MVSIREVADRAGVSLGTVSNVLNHPEVVAEATRRRVQQVIEELEFVRNGSAHQLRAGQSQHLGLVVLDVTNPFFTEVARGVEDVANEANYVIMLCNSDDSLSKEGRYLHMLEEQRTAGILITPVQDESDSLRRLRQKHVPVVLLDRPSRAQDLCSVTVDDELGGEMAACHLLELGHRRIAFVRGSLSNRQCAERRMGVRRAIKKAGYDPADILIDIPVAALNASAGEGCVDMTLSHKPTAVFCANDLLALGVMRGLLERKLRIPDDVALVGYDDVEFAASLSPALTSVRQPKYQLGRAAAELLLREINSSGEHRHQQLVYQPELIVRTSTRGV
jgi:LacI family transcriptional regulator